MLIIEIECPHCGAKGQVPLQSLGSVQIGPCPECKGLILLICGRTLALENQIMYNGTFDKKYNHLMTVIQGGWEPIVNDMANQVYPPDIGAESGLAAAIPEIAKMFDPPPRHRQRPTGQANGPITQARFDHFVDHELGVLDNATAFLKIFGQKPEP